MVKKKYLSAFIVGVMISIMSLSSFASAAVDNNKIVEVAMDKTPILKMIEKSNKEVGLSEFYDTTNPNDEDFEAKFKKLAEKIDSNNKKNGYESDFDLDKILKSENLREDTSISIGSGNGDGWNSFDASVVANGDIVLIDNQGLSIQGEIQHAGMMVRSYYYGGADDQCFHTAQPNIGVTFETQTQYRAYDYSYKLGVNTSISAKDNAVNQAFVDASQGETYDFSTDKYNTYYWYCSKVPWSAYYSYNSGYIDIDFDAGYWVLPQDIFADGDTTLYAIWD